MQDPLAVEAYREAAPGYQVFMGVGAGCFFLFTFILISCFPVCQRRAAYRKILSLLEGLRYLFLVPASADVFV